MDDTPEVIRQRMDETRSQLSEKLETLEQQVTETVQSTGDAVNATVGAVQETIESVTGAVQDAVQSVSNAVDLRRQIHRHPWLVIGGSVAVGYLAAEFLSASRKPSSRPSASADNPNQGNGPAMGGESTATALVAAHESGLESSSWRQLRDVAFGAIIGMVQEITSRAVPPLVDYLTGQRSSGPLEAADSVAEQHGSPRRRESLEATRGRSFGASETVRPAIRSIRRHDS